MAATAEWYLERKIHSVPLTSAHAVSIPGAIDAWATLLRNHGKFGLDTLLQPAIKAAEAGLCRRPRIAFDWKNQFEKLKNGTNTERYLLPHGKPAVAGDVIHQAELGKTLRAIAKDGRDAFYYRRDRRGHGRDLARHRRPAHAGGLCQHTPPKRPRRSAPSYKGHDVWQCPPNGPGITMLVMLNILSRFDLTKFPALSVERFHLEAEAARIAYMMREQHIGDPQHVHVDVAGILAREFADEHIKQHQDGPAARSAERRAADESLDRLHHRGRQAIATSAPSSTRSRIPSVRRSSPTRSGILLQNRAGGFRIQPGHPNCIAPGKRPLHTIIPSLATRNGRAIMPFGVMGGQYQPVGQTHVLTNMLDYGCDVQEAIDMPRGLHYEGVYQLEDSVPAEIVEGLKKIGHKTTSVVGPLGGGQAIWIDWDKGTLTGGSDPRKDGCALGY